MAPQGDNTNAKQLIVGRINQATNIMVTVGNNPSIDALSALLALALTLNKLDKHATAVFSGQAPAVMQFLNPEKTFEGNVDSLRDFIISLDKEKADRLRYKLEKDVVRIFITPYRTTITQADLQFSQGDFNVDLVIALGVDKRDDLDKAVIAHGRILHDATVVTINSNGQQSNLGAVDWNDPNASSLCEMLVTLIEALQKPGLLDSQIANALLTGIVAATDRFSNQHTTPRVMTMSAQLMAAGANQQLVSVNMQKGMEPPSQTLTAEQAEEESAAGPNGEISIKHPAEEKKSEEPETPPELPKEEEKPAEESPQPETPEEEPQADTAAAEAELDANLPKPEPEPDLNKSLDDLSAQLDEVAKAEQTHETPSAAPTPRKFVSEAPSTEGQELGDEPQGPAPAPHVKDEKSANSWRGHRLEPPTLGGSLSSTSEEALEDSLRVEEDQRNHQILSHDSQPDSGEPASVADAPAPPQPSDQPPTLNPATPPESAQPAPEAGGASIDEARKAVGDVLNNQEFNPAGSPRTDLGAQQMGNEPIQPYIPLEPTVPPAPGQPAAPAPPPTDANGLPIIPPMPSLPTEDPSMPNNMPPMPPPLPPLPGEQAPGTPPPTDPNAPPDPNQFKIPS